MTKPIRLALSFFWITLALEAQDGMEVLRPYEKKYAADLLSTNRWSDARFDATYYGLDVRISSEPWYLRGAVTIKARSLEDGLAEVRLDLINSLTVDSVAMGNTHCLYGQSLSAVTIDLDRIYALNEIFEITVYYQGAPGSSGFGSFVFSSHNGTPWIWSLSEPYGARDWWPCKDHPSDKADSVDVRITCDSSFKAASNGLLVSVTDNGDGTKTHHWKERYPIATYLVSVAITDFSEFTNWFHYSPADSMPILNYVLPEHLPEALASLPMTAGMLGIFSDLFGMYPFVNEKYGHAEFGWGGAMEHQTMTSITYPFDESAIAHELAHQWFGDMITMRTWPDLWLNEGFASYSEALYFEAMYGVPAYWSVISDDITLARTSVGTLYVQDTSHVGNLFNTNRVYKKGSIVLHMLRHVLGDSLFFESLWNYTHDPSVRFGTASTEDFKNVCERTSGKDLDYFFDQWVFGERYPSYTYAWTIARTDSGYRAHIQLSQTTGTTNPSFFTMPIDFTFSSAGWDTTVVWFNNTADQNFTVDHLSRQPTQLQLDPGDWILKSAAAVDSQGHPLNPYRFGLKQNYPNPFNGSTVIGYELRNESDVVIEVYNTLGERIRTLLTARLWRGPHQITWDGRDHRGRSVASGVYICRLKAGPHTQSRKMLWIK